MREVPFPQPGGCYCGAVRFKLTALPYFSYLCHCSMCRRRTGAAYGISTPIPPNSLSIVTGDLTFQDRATASGVKGKVAACSSCGGKLYSAWDGAPYWTFRPGLLDDSSWITPVGQMWTANALPWALLNDVPSFEGNPPSLQPFIGAWNALDLRLVERPA